MNYFQNIDWANFLSMLVVPAIILFASLAIGILLNRILKQKVPAKIAIDDSEIKNIFFRALHGVPIYFSFIVGLYWIVNTSSHLPEGLVKIFSYLLFAAIIFSLTRVVERTLSGFIRLKFSGTGDTSQSTLLDTIFRVLIYSSGLLVVLDYYGISIAPIITAMGVGGMAVAFGVRETLENIFSGLQLLISKQMQIGDYIKLSTGDEGKIVDINWRFISIMPPNEGSVVVIPNKVIAASVSTNYSRPREDIVLSIPIGVSYDSDLEQVEKVTVEVAREIMTEVDGYEPDFNENGFDKNPLAPVVRYQNFSDSSIDFLAVLHATQFKSQYLMKHKFIKEITKRYREEGINIPFPIRTVVLPDVVENDFNEDVNFKKG